jgi:hypothetical protein
MTIQYKKLLFLVPRNKNIPKDEYEPFLSSNFLIFFGGLRQLSCGPDGEGLRPWSVLLSKSQVRYLLMSLFMLSQSIH